MVKEKNKKSLKNDKKLELDDSSDSDDEKEIWKDIEEDNGEYVGRYQISNMGNVHSFISGKQLSPSLRSGYKSVKLTGTTIKGGTFKIHRLVASAFVKQNAKEHTAVNHLDANKLNNRASNLEWTTILENNKHGYIVGNNRVTKRAVNKIDPETGEILEKFESLQDARIATGVDDAGIAKVCKGTRPKAGGFKWEFAVKNENEGQIDLTGFVDLKDFPNYKISNNGTVYSIRFKKVLKFQINADGYPTISLANNGDKKTFLVHRLVAEHFLDKIKGKLYVNHKDGVKTNSNVDNLEWTTCSENSKHACDMKKAKNQLKV